MSSKPSNLQSILLYGVAIFALYQQYCIFQLQYQVADIQERFTKFQPSAGSSAVISSGLVIDLHEKSPPPAVPAFEVKAGDTRSVGGILEKGKQIYGGVGDEVHLGGFTEIDIQTISHNFWNFLLGPMAVRSIIDIGCGRGISTKYFKDRGARVLCVEGSHDAIKHSYLPKDVIVQHDYSKGKWWPEETFDLAYSTEFVEHIGRQYHPNYMATMKRAAIVLFTASAYGGYHHVEVQDHVWWLSRFQANGFLYSVELTNFMKKQLLSLSKGGQTLDGMKVFINPAVASLPQHRHIFGGNGCFRGSLGNHDGGEACPGVDALPIEYQSLLNCDKYYVKAQNWTDEPWDCKQNPNLVGAKLRRK